ncbi:MAG: efflux RND transporter periplasmic adaptor subunit [Halanaerobiales bacterium]
MKKKIIIVLVLLLIVGIVVYRGISAGESEDVPRVNTEVLEKGELKESVEADGDVIAAEEIKFSSELSGRVAEVFVEEGDFVEEDEPLFRLKYETIRDHFDVFSLVERTSEDFTGRLFKKQIEREERQLRDVERNLRDARLSREEQRLEYGERITDLEGEIEDLEVDVQEAKEQLQKGEKLISSGGITEEELESRRRNYNKLSANLKRSKNKLENIRENRMPNALEAARVRVAETESALEREEENFARRKARLRELLDDLTVDADRDGTLIGFDVKPGDHISAEKTVGRIADLENLLAEVWVDEIDINSLEKGQEAEITGDAFDPVLEGEVSLIAPEAVESGNVNEFRTEITVEDPEGVLRPGMFVTAEIITSGKDDIVTAPAIAIMEEDNQEYVFLFSDGRAERQEVETGISTPDRVEISGVDQGEEIIVGPFDLLRSLEDGQKVRRK